MELLIGLLIIAIGSFGQSSSYVPIKKVKEWSWESFWLTQGLFAWLVFPLLGALLAIPEGQNLFAVIGTADSSAILKTIFFGVLWGIGGLTFGLSMRYLGVALGQSIALGTCSAFGTLIPPLLPSLFPEAKPLTLLLTVGVAIMLAGISIIGYAGALKAQNLSEEEKRKAVKDFALKKGLLIALLSGVMSACFNLGLEAGAPIKKVLLDNGVDALYAGLPSILLVTLGGFVANACYCIGQNIKNKTGKEYFSVKGNVLMNNLLFCALAGGLWYSQFFGFEMGKSFLTGSPVLLAFSWGILMSLNVTFSNLWGIWLKEWKGVGTKTVTVLIVGLLVLISSIILMAIANPAA
ncbi:MAG: L-rhamnose/proton symporter RhaT [Prevotellaceae bacterium]|jgi:L-rhamnose-H+ transport protein|nr:L-rhamnose/proton symporter RhaT [Prevotellaceae bacterium]